MKELCMMIVGIIGALCCLFGLISLLTLTSKSVSLMMFGFGLLLLLCVGLPHIINMQHNQIWTVLHQCLCAGMVLVIVVMLVVSGFMAFGVNRYQQDQFNGTVVVLGCHVKGDQPSTMLAGRLDKAVVFLARNPDSTCIVSGGQGENEQYPESQIMKRYLIEHGISENRIIEENRSTSTQTNIEYSNAIIARDNLPQDVVVITDAFHQYRAKLFCDKYQLKSQSVPCETRLDLQILFWMREIPAVLKTWLF